MKKIFIMVLLALTVQKVNGQVSSSAVLYEPHMASLFESWAAHADSVSRFCQDRKPCGLYASMKKGSIPFSVHFLNSSGIFDIDEESIEEMIEDVISSRYRGYRAESADKYRGPHSDVLVLNVELSAFKLIITSRFEMNEERQLLLSDTCENFYRHNAVSDQRRDGKVQSVQELSAMWSNAGFSDFKLGGIVSQQLTNVVACYVESKRWPTYRDFYLGDKSRNPWYVHGGND